MKPTSCSSISCCLTEQVPADSHRWLHLWPQDHVLLLINSTSVTVVMSSFTPQLGWNVKVSHRPPCVYLIDHKPKWMKSGLEKSLSRVTFQALSPVVTSRLSVSAPVAVMNKWKPLWCQSVCGSPSRVFFLSKGAVTGVFDTTKKHGDPESSRRFFFLFLFRRKKWKVKVSPRCQVLLHNSDLKRGAYIISSRSLGPDLRHLLCKGPLRAAVAPQRPSEPLLTSSNRVPTSLIYW